MNQTPIAVMVCLTLLASSAAAQESGDDERARVHFDAGLLHYQEGAYDRALVEFQRAWELSHRPVLLINLATVKERLGMHSEAAAHLREYIRLMPEDEQNERLTRRIENLERLQRERDAGATDAATNAPDEAPPSGATPSAATRTDDGLMTGAIIGYAVAGAGAVVMGVFGGLALAEESELASGCGELGTCSDAEVADANTFALVSDVGLGVALAGAAAGTVLLIMALAGGSSAETAWVSPWLSPQGAGVSTGVRF